MTSDGSPGVELTGQWAGTWQMSSFSGTFEMDVVQRAQDVTGTASATMGGMSYLRDAELTATVRGATLSGVVTDNNVGMTFELTVDGSGNALGGTFSSKFAGQELSGRMDMQRH